MVVFIIKHKNLGLEDMIHGVVVLVSGTSNHIFKMDHHFLEWNFRGE